MFRLFLATNIEQAETVISSRMKVHDSITLVKHSKKKNLKRTSQDISNVSRTSIRDEISSTSVSPKKSKTSHGINKNVILQVYQKECTDKGITLTVSTTNKGETHPTLPPYPPCHLLVKNCTMKPSTSHYYRIGNLHFDNVIIFLIKDYEKYLSRQELGDLRLINSFYKDMIDDILRLRTVDFSDLKKTRLGYNEQTCISHDRVEKTTACFIHYGFHPGMMIRYIKGEFVNEHLDVDSILVKVAPHVTSSDANHIHRILTQGCPSHIDFEETFENKQFVLQKGNQHSFLQLPEVTAKAINKEERNSHVLPLKLWTVHFSPYCRATPQGLKEKNGKYRVIFDASTQSKPDEVVLNHVTPTDLEPEIDFGQAKMKLLVNIYNWRISFPGEEIYLALFDVTACFRQQHISCDVTGAFGFVANGMYFLSTSHVFGSNGSASGWEPRRRGIENLIPVYARRQDLVDRHRELIESLSWYNSTNNNVDRVRAIPCEINQGVIINGRLNDLKASIYVDDILGAAVARTRMTRLIAAIIEAVYVVCGTPDESSRQNPLSIEKLLELIIQTRQTVLGLIINTDRMTLGITEEYLQQVRELLSKWDHKKQTFNVKSMQKLVGKLARLGEGAPWIYKLMSHLYTSLAVALRSNTELLKNSSVEFKALIKQIYSNDFHGNIPDHQRHINYAMKQAARMTNSHKHPYIVNTTMREELKFITEALSPDSGIKFETSIAHIIPRIPTAQIIGDSSLQGCGGYSIKLKFWWHLSFPVSIVERTLLHLRSKSDPKLISINCLEYVTIIVGYCAALVRLENNRINDDPNPVVLCVTDNTSALNWTLHTSKKSIIGRALARFFCGLLIGSNVGINAKWISTIENVIADKISRLKKTNKFSSNFSYDYTKLQQEHKELQACNFFHPSPKLLSLLWNILLTGKCPDLNDILKLKPSDLGRLTT